MCLQTFKDRKVCKRLIIFERKKNIFIFERRYLKRFEERYLTGQHETNCTD